MPRFCSPKLIGSSSNRQSWHQCMELLLLVLVCKFSIDWRNVGLFKSRQKCIRQRVMLPRSRRRTIMLYLAGLQNENEADEDEWHISHVVHLTAICEGTSNLMLRYCKQWRGKLFWKELDRSIPVVSMIGLSPLEEQGWEISGTPYWLIWFRRIFSSSFVLSIADTKLISLLGFHSEGLKFHGFMMNLIDHIVQIIIHTRPNL